MDIRAWQSTPVRPMYIPSRYWTGPECIGITRTRMDLQFTRQFFLRLIFQYNDFSKGYDLEPLLTYRINPFTVFYVGSTQSWTDFGDDFAEFGIEETERQYFAKFQYLFHN